MKSTIEEVLNSRVLVLDGAMGTMIQRYNLTEKDYCGEKFKNWHCQLKGCNDLLNISRPDVIEDIHYQYLMAGADIIETNTFSSQRISLSEYGLENSVSEINKAAVAIAKRAVERASKKTSRPMFIVASIGPTGKSMSMAADVSDPAVRGLYFKDAVAAYEEQIQILVESGVDAILSETIFDALNAKAVIFATENVMNKIGVRVPIMLSATIADKSGRILSGQTIDAFLASVAHANLLSIGLNCSFGAKDMLPYVEKISQAVPCFVSAYPNAGLPNQFGEYDASSEKMATEIETYFQKQVINIIGGCCGTTPDHIRCIAQLRDKYETNVRKKNSITEHPTIVSGLDVLKISKETPFVKVGERCNVAGSKKFLRLIKEGNYDEALQIARHQVEAGAKIIDVNMDDALLNSTEQMQKFLFLLSSEPEIARCPIMIDSSSWETIEIGLQSIQGKCIVNSISLKEGEEEFLRKAKCIQNYGAAVVVMAFDEKGQADTFDRKKEICQRAYNLLTQKLNFNPSDIIFDPNILAIATGIEEHNAYALYFIQATEWIKKNLPGALVSGGVSNLSFAFRGNNLLREMLHTVFLHHAQSVGMDMGIVNPTTSISYETISDEMKQLCEDLIFCRDENVVEKLIDASSKLQPNEVKNSKTENWRSSDVEERLFYEFLHGDEAYINSDILEALKKYKTALAVVEGPLMDIMNRIGLLFEKGDLFLPQLVKTARIMKKAVTILQPYMQVEESKEKAVTIVVATVKGDVHDIGKNILTVVLSCSGYRIVDLGVMVDEQTILSAVKNEKADFVCLSGLITPSLSEMTTVAKLLNKNGLTVPLIIGGATTSAAHTALKIATEYKAPVFYSKDASQNAYIIAQYLSKNTRQELVDKLGREQQLLREKFNNPAEVVSLKDAQNKKPNLF